MKMNSIGVTKNITADGPVSTSALPLLSYMKIKMEDTYEMFSYCMLFS